MGAGRLGPCSCTGIARRSAYRERYKTRLSRLEIFGFKSFADRATFEFAPGITAFVGPNGSGKSNVVDALRWVFGEQNPRILRGARWDEVIFAGSASRRPLGLAEVAVTIDNTAGSLGIPQREVEISRRLLRSGDTDYAINRLPCRLKDIHDLIAGTGAAGASYAYVPQAAVDEILKSRPEDRREVIEEAVGLARYRGRRAEAQRRLAEVDVARERLRDLAVEIETQLEPLAQEAAAAETFLALRTEHEDLSARVWADGMARVLRRQAANQARRESLDMTLAELDQSRTGLVEELATGQDGLVRLRRTRSETDHRFRSLAGEENRWRASLAVLEERRGHLKRSEVTLRARVAAAQKRLDQLAAELASLESATDESLPGHDGAAQARTAAEAARIAEHISGEQARIAEARRELAEARAELDRLRTSHAANSERARSLCERADRAAARVARLEFQQAELSAQAVDRQAKRNASMGRLDEARARVTALRSELAELEGDAQSADAKLAAARELVLGHRGRLTVARERVSAVIAARGRLPLAAAAREASVALAASAGKQARPLAELLAVQPGFEKAIATALGLAQHALVTGDWGDALGLVELRPASADGGQLVLLPARVERHPVTLRAAAGLSPAGAYVKSSDQNMLPDAVLQELLAPFVVVQSLSQAVEFCRSEHSGPCAAVSKDGSAVLPGGVIVHGSPDAATSPIELAHLENELAATAGQLESALRSSSAAEARAIAEHESITKRKRDAMSQLGQAEHELAELSRVHEALNDEARRFVARAESTAVELQDARQDQAAAVQGADSASREAAALSERMTGSRECVEAATLQLAALEQAVATRRDELHQVRLHLAQLEQESRNRLDKIGRLEAERDALTADVTDATTALAETAEVLAQAETGLADAEERVASCRQERDAAESSVRSISHELRAHEASVESRQSELDRVSRAHADVIEQLHRLDLAEERLAGELHGLEIERRSLASRHAGLQPEQVSDGSALRTRREAIEAELSELGPVNPGAAEQARRLEKRRAFLREQEADLAQSAATLADSALELEREIEVRFMAGFTQIRESFAAVFTALFGGGRADLELTDHASPLSSGVEIMAQPPGKRMTSLALLSGGERALTAIALLFAVIGRGTASFCVLDEVDAHLDEPNCLRFRRYLRSLAGERQFLVVTHSKVTMEAADLLYGLTMEEDGVSRVISARLDQDRVATLGGTR